MSDKPDFAKCRLRPEEWRVIRKVYAETYPVRPLLNHVDDLLTALSECAGRFERCCIDAGSDGDYAALAVARYREIARGVSK